MKQENWKLTHKILNVNEYSSTMPNRQKSETTQMSFNEWMNTQTGKSIWYNTAYSALKRIKLLLYPVTTRISLKCRINPWYFHDPNKVQGHGGTWVAQLVKCPTLTQVMILRFVGSSPVLGVLCWQLRAWSLLWILCLLSLPLPCLSSLSLSLFLILRINKR